MLKDTQIDVMAILNDTTGSLMSSAYLNHNVKIGLILGEKTTDYLLVFVTILLLLLLTLPNQSLHP